MVKIPDCKPVADDAEVEKCVKEVLADFQHCREYNEKWNKGSESISSEVNTQICATGGYRMSVVDKVCEMFDKKGYYVYLVRGGAYNNWSWFRVQNYPSPEGYGSARYPNYTQRWRKGIITM